MKLRNFMYATMIACAFASCSKDDVVGPDGPDTAKGDASLTIGVSALKSTKALIADGETIGEGIESEDNIKSLTLVVFNSNGAYLASASSANSSTVTVSGLNPQTIKFMVLANMDIATTTLQGLTSTTIMNQAVVLPATGFTKDSEQGLPMSSALVEKDGQNDIVLVSGNNYYGYAAGQANAAKEMSTGDALDLVRNVSRVDLMGVNLHMKMSDYSSGKASFKFTDVKIKNAAKNAIIGGASSANTEFVTGGADATYYIQSDATLAAKEQTDFTSSAVPVEAPNAYFYVLANGQTTPTQLVVGGNFTLTDGVNKETGVTESFSGAGLYPITIGITNTGADNTGSALTTGLVNNNIYRITLYVAGPGESEGGKKAKFFVNTEVKEWDTVDQGAIIK